MVPVLELLEVWGYSFVAITLRPILKLYGFTYQGFIDESNKMV